MPTLSIAMATYNGDRFLQEQLDSFARQTLAPTELVICDDASTDSTRAIVERFAVTAPFEVRLTVNQTRLGYSENFAQAIEQARGDLIFISDQDDEWLDDKLGSTVARFEAAPACLSLVHDQIISAPDGTPTDVTVLGNVRRAGYTDLAFGPGCCTVLRRSLLPLLTPFPKGVPYDHWINIVPALLGIRIVEERALQTYRRHDTNASGSVFADPGASLFAMAIANRSNPRQAFANQIAQNDIIADALDHRRTVIAELGLSDQLAGAIRHLERERDDFSARLACLDQHGPARLGAVAKLWRGRGYAHFRGWKTALKDILT